MELCSPDLLSSYHTAKGRAVVSDSCYSLLILRLNIVGMDKVKVGIGWNVGKDRQIKVQWHDLIPAHMRYLWSVRNAPYLATKEAKTINFALSMMVCQQLHAEADTKKWFALLCSQENSIVQATLGHPCH